MKFLMTVITIVFIGISAHAARTFCTGVFGREKVQVEWFVKAEEYKEYKKQLDKSDLFNDINKFKNTKLQVHQGTLYRLFSEKAPISIWSLDRSWMNFTKNSFKKLLILRTGDVVFILDKNGDITFEKLLNFENLTDNEKAFNEASMDFGFPMYKRPINIAPKTWSQYFSLEEPYKALIVRVRLKGD